MRHRILSLPGEAIQSDRQSRDSYGLKPVQLQMSHPSASQWISPLNLAFPVLNDHEQVAHWTADTLRVAIVTPQTRYLAGRLTCCSILLANFKRMCVSLQLRGNYDSRIYRDWQKGPTVVELFTHSAPVHWCGGCTAGRQNPSTSWGSCCFHRVPPSCHTNRL